jgi:nucleoside-diphosphate-sugar epimerase
MKKKRIVVTGAAGLVGQNLIPRLRKSGHSIVGIDKHPMNTQRLGELNPEIEVIEADLAEEGKWMDSFAGADTLVLNHAQIGALEEEPFIRNNITATQRVLSAAKHHSIENTVHISSSVVNSAALDYYTESKKAQEKLVVESGLAACILRPTLMFGWFDRKHLGWLARFMQRTPVFPIPGDGRYLRQPLYVGDFCEIISSCIEHPRSAQAFNISGQQKVDYLDLIKEVRSASGARAALVNIPYSLFWVMLRAYALIDDNPPFTTLQLKALVTPDVFEVIDWPAIFGVEPTPLSKALKETFRHPTYSNVVLDF